MLQLNIVNYHTGEFKQKTFSANSPDKIEWLVGRRPNCDLVLTSPEISRVHGKFLWEQNKYYFSDLGSTDGSRLNSKDLQANHNYPIKENDLIVIGNFILAIKKVEIDIASPEQNQSKIHLSNSVRQWNSEDLVVRCQQIIDETADVKTFRFVADSPVSFTYEPGQFVNLELNIDGQPVARSYSISSTPSRSYTLEITVKRVPAPFGAPDVPPGLVSNWLHDHLKVGSQVKLIGGAMGKFTCTTKPPRKVLMISAGSGITPMISMSRWIYDTIADSDVVFFHNARSPQDIIMRQELETIAFRHPNFRLAISVTCSELAQPWFGFKGRFSETILNSIAPDFKERTVYVCGPDGFMQEVKHILSSQNFPMENYHQESFGGRKQQRKKPSPQAVDLPPIQEMIKVGAMTQGQNPQNQTPTDKALVTHGSKISNTLIQTPVEYPSPTPPASNQPAVFFSQLGQEVICDEEESILDVAEQQGVKIRSGCRQGVCGACKKRKLRGEIRYEGEPDGLSDGDDGYILTCIAFPVGRVAIEA